MHTSDIADRNASVLAWFEDNRRPLPWRMTTDPYPVLVSEVMLQQTQVSRVTPKFLDFMKSWPDVESLAAANTASLLQLWSGLGYNSRALRLRETARIVASSGWPDSITGLKKLPGIGPYTAAAVGSISFAIDVPAVDTNLKWILSRWAGEPLSGPELDAYAACVVGEPAGDWNQALMDLGSAVCGPRDPVCAICPVSTWCVDPTVYEAPRRQTRFEGSHRQLRGALLRAHLAGDSLVDTGMALNHSGAETVTAIDSLASEGLLD